MCQGDHAASATGWGWVEIVPGSFAVAWYQHRPAVTELRRPKAWYHAGMQVLSDPASPTPHTHLLSGVHVQLAARKVVEEEHGLRAAGDNVVHAHGYQVDAHRVVLVHVKRQLQLCAHTVGARHQERVACMCGAGWVWLHAGKVCFQGG